MVVEGRGMGTGNWEVIKQAKVDVRERHNNKGSIRQHDETIQTITTNKLEAVTTTLHLAEKPYAFHISGLLRRPVGHRLKGLKIRRLPWFRLFRRIWYVVCIHRALTCHIGRSCIG